jgi:sigma-B regulation protein RsbU (phosphoserine phosphatase)
VNHIVAELLVAQPEAIIHTSFRIDEPIECDRERLEQLLSNLLGNAITHGKKSEPISLHAQTHSGFLEIWIANAGEPISNAGMEKLFQPFFRGDVRDSQHGLGLGLHIASEIAKAHGGTLSATSSPDETRFTLRMPVRQERAALIHQRPIP